MGSDCFCFWKRDSDFRQNGATVDTERSQKSQGKINVLKNIDCVPSNVQSLHQEAFVVCV